MKRLFFLLLLCSCNKPITTSNFPIKDINFNQLFTFEEYKEKIEIYNQINGYPKLD